MQYHPREAATSQQETYPENFGMKIGKCQPPATPGPRRSKGKHGGEKQLLTILLCTMETHAEKIGSCMREPRLWPQNDDGVVANVHQEDTGGPELHCQ